MITAPDFSKYQNFNYIAAINDAIALARGRVAALKASGKADFSVIAELETCDEELGAILEIFYSLLGTDTTDALQALASSPLARLRAALVAGFWVCFWTNSNFPFLGPVCCNTILTCVKLRMWSWRILARVVRRGSLLRRDASRGFQKQRGDPDAIASDL